MEKNFKNVMAGLNEINKKIQEARISKEEKHQYLKAVVEHLDTGIVSFNSRGEAELVNKAALVLLGIKSIKTIDSINTCIPGLRDIFRDDFGDGVVIINSAGQNMELVVKAKMVKISGEPIRIYSFQNIRQELENRELESWKKLIRVLRHEIMNSMTPITTLTTAIKRSFSGNGVLKQVTEISQTNLQDAIAGAEVIEERSKGLISFVENFRNITDLPKPVFKSFPVAEMFDKVELLFRNVLNEMDIKLSIISEPDLHLYADPHLLEQVLINLVKNSIEAIDHGGKIGLGAFRENQKICIQVTDNGSGIHEEDLENIFVPSFTTKEDGMGVGLSICRQIIQLHKGEIRVKSESGETVFEIMLS
jgi:nitrogen fixation/metabolism regulation signal transduction histidine kinase